MCKAAAELTGELNQPSAPPPAPPPVPVVVISDEEAALMAKARALLADYDPENVRPARPNTFEPHRSAMIKRQRQRDAARDARKIGRGGGRGG